MNFFLTTGRRYFPLSMLVFKIVDDQKPFKNQGNRMIEVWNDAQNQLLETINANQSQLPDNDLLKQEIAARSVSLP